MLKTSSCSQADKTNINYFDALAQEILGSGSYLRFKAHGSSMYPFIQDGDILLIKPKSSPEFNVGDVIFYRRPWGSYVAHRLIKKDGPTALIIKGDNLPGYDAPVPIKQALGKVIAIERDGHCIRLDSGPNQWLNRAWAKLSPISRWLHPILRPWWRLYRRCFMVY